MATPDEFVMRCLFKLDAYLHHSDSHEEVEAAVHGIGTQHLVEAESSNKKIRMRMIENGQ